MILRGRKIPYQKHARFLGKREEKRRHPGGIIFNCTDCMLHSRPSFRIPLMGCAHHICIDEQKKTLALNSRLVRNCNEQRASLTCAPPLSRCVRIPAQAPEQLGRFWLMHCRGNNQRRTLPVVFFEKEKATLSIMRNCTFHNVFLPKEFPLRSLGPRTTQ